MERQSIYLVVRDVIAQLVQHLHNTVDLVGVSRSNHRHQLLKQTRPVLGEVQDRYLRNNRSSGTPGNKNLAKHR